MRQASLQVILDKEERVLMLQRTSEHKLFPNEWCLPGGKRETVTDRVGHMEIVDYIETIEVTNYRETKEELGLKVYVARRLPITCMDDHFECIPFLAVGSYSDGDITKEFPNREHTQYCWFSFGNLPKNTGRMTRDLIWEALQWKD